MGNMRFARILFPLLVSLWSTVAASDETDVVERLVTAYNAQDVEGLIELTTEDIRWMGISGDSLSVETDGRVAFREAMAEYFSSRPSARSNILSIAASGAFVQTIERATWTVDDAERSLCSMGIYEVAGDRIRNVWYFPAHECSGDPSG